MYRFESSLSWPECHLFISFWVKILVTEDDCSSDDASRLCSRTCVLDLVRDTRCPHFFVDSHVSSGQSEASGVWRDYDGSRRSHTKSSVLWDVRNSIHNVRDWFCQKLTWGLLANVALVCAYAPLPELLPFLNASWKPCCVSVLITACDSPSITSVVSELRPFSCIFNRGNRGSVRGPSQASRVGGERQTSQINITLFFSFSEINMYIFPPEDGRTTETCSG
jgi:hypothetical protein